MTKEEKALWYRFLKNLPILFYRQKPIGEYILDFYCASKKLAIELDGSQHFEDEGLESDELRTAFLQSLGIKVLRFSNLEIKQNFAGVCQMILNEIGLEE